MLYLRAKWAFGCCVLLLLRGSLMIAQRQAKHEAGIEQIDLQQFVEDIFAIQDPESGANYEDLYEALYQLYWQPLDLNTATREELLSLYILRDFQINNLLQYRYYAGKLISIYELQAVPGFDLETIRRLLPFVKVVEKDTYASGDKLLTRILKDGNSELVVRTTRILQTQKGYTPPTLRSDSTYAQRYVGSPYQLYARFRLSRMRDFSLGFTAEKDAGEAISWNPAARQYGMDFYSFHMTFWNKRRFKTIILGDYQLQIGQGLLLQAGFRVGKGGETVQTVRRSSIGIRPYTAVLEAGFFRGVAATYELIRLPRANMEITGFLSYVRQSAHVQQQYVADTLLDAPADTELYISNIQTTGFHRTPSELAARRSIGERTSGVSLVYRRHNQKLELGLTALHTHFSLPLRRRPTVYNQFEFSGQQNHNLGIHYTWNWQNFNFFGEAACSASGGVAFVKGYVASLSPTLDMAMLYRYYERDFHSFYGNPFSEGFRPVNEKGFYWGMKFTPWRNIWLSAYYDKFAFPWLRFRADAPSQGYEYLIRLNYTPYRRVMFYFQYREESREDNLHDNEPLNTLSTRVRQNYWWVFRYQVDRRLGLQSRLQYSTYRLAVNSSQGLALAQDISLAQTRWELWARFVVFDTDNYQNRQFMYERNVLYTFSLPAYQDVGYRYVLMLRYNISPRLNCWIRYAHTTLWYQETIGSGLEQIEGNQRSELRIQLRYRM